MTSFTSSLRLSTSILTSLAYLSVSVGSTAGVLDPPDELPPPEELDEPGELELPELLGVLL